MSKMIRKIAKAVGFGFVLLVNIVPDLLVIGIFLPKINVVGESGIVV